MRALIVDDSVAMRKIMGRILEKAGFDIDLASDGQNALSVPIRSSLKKRSSGALARLRAIRWVWS